MYGTELERAYGGHGRTATRSGIGSVERTPAGNVAVRIGTENEYGGTWTQTAYVVLTPDEARTVAGLLERAARPFGADETVDTAARNAELEEPRR